METTTKYMSTESTAILRMGRQQALEKWGSFVSSAESLLKIKGMTLDKLCVALRSAIQFGSLESCLPQELVEEELRKLVPFTLKDFWGMCQDDKNWTLPDSNKASDGPIGLRADRLQKIALQNGGEYVTMFCHFSEARIFGKPMPECPA